MIITMRNRLIIILALILSVGIGTIASAQNSLILKRMYRLDNKSATEEVGGYNGTIHGTVTSCQDQYGHGSGAMQFSDNAYISIPSPVSGFDYQTTGFTVSFWTYIDENLYKQYGRTPWSDSDPVVRAFYSKNDTDNVILSGFHRRGDRMVLDRYTRNTSNALKNWGIWLWDPVNFTTRMGWYHIVISYEPSRTFVRAFYPDGQMVSSAYYFGIQDYSVATHWGIGNSSGKSLILDTFSVYQGAATEAQARNIHAEEMLPNGMYKISLAANEQNYVHTVNHGTAGSTPVEIAGPSDNRHVYKWVITPVYGKQNVYTIRMAYEEQYLHLAGHVASQSTRVEILEYQPSYAQYYEWFIDSSGDGYFYIKSNADRTKYLHPVSHSSASGARLEVLEYSESYSQMYKWRLNLLKTQFEIDQKPVAIDSPHEVILSDNTFLGLMPDTPIQGDVATLKVNRGPYPSLLTYWWFLPGKDDSFKIYNASHLSYDLHPKSREVAVGTEIEALKYSYAYEKYYSFVVEKPNKYGRRVQIKPALNTDLLVTANSIASGNKLSLQNAGDNKANQWALFKSNQPGANKELYDLKPGIYRIVSLADEEKAVTTRDNAWTTTSDILIGAKNSTKYTSYYWIVDYEKDANGKPVMDGTYTIQLFSTDSLYWHTKSHAMSNSAKLELYHLDRDYLNVEKWFIKPTRAGDGAYYIQCAGDPSLYVHLTSHSTQADTQLELLSFNSSYANTFKWKFQAVSVTAPFDTGIQKVKTLKDQTKYLHVKSRSTADAQPLEILSYNASYQNFYKWQFVKNADNTYMIQNVVSGYYVHPKGHSTQNGTRLEQLQYNASYAPYYKWIIVPGTQAGSYKIISVADPTKYIHLSGHLATEGNEVEILLYNQGYPNTYEWVLE